MKSEAEIMARIEMLDLKRCESERNAETARQLNDGAAYLSAKGYAVQTSTEMAILAWCLEPSDFVFATPAGPEFCADCDDPVPFSALED